jgi:gluconolactonase
MATESAGPDFRETPIPEYRVIAEGLEFPEGPVALGDGSILVVEIQGGKLTRIWPDGAMATVAHVGGGPNGAAIGPDGCCYIANNGGHRWANTPSGPVPAGVPEGYTGGKIQRVSLGTGNVEELYTHHENGKLTSPNDLVFDQWGGFWFTDSGKNNGRSRFFGSVCYARPDGSFIKERIFPMIAPNGIGLSPSGDLLYVAETTTSRLWSFEVTGPGEVSKGRGPAPHGGKLVCNVGGYRLLDSLAVDIDGHIHVATLMDAGIARISPDGTRVVHTRFPDTYTTNLCFGGRDMATAYVTLTQSGRLVSFEPGVSGLPLNFAR